MEEMMEIERLYAIADAQPRKADAAAIRAFIARYVAMRDKAIDRCEELAAKIFDEKLAARITELEAVLEKWKTWCELNRREGSILYKPTCEVLAKARNP